MTYFSRKHRRTEGVHELAISTHLGIAACVFHVMIPAARRCLGKSTLNSLSLPKIEAPGIPSTGRKVRLLAYRRQSD